MTPSSHRRVAPNPPVVTATGNEVNIQSLINPRSIALLGASDRPSIGRTLMQSLANIGFDGAIYPVNPRYSEIMGQRCYGALAELPAVPDLVAFCISGARVLENFRQLAALAVPAAVIYDSGFAEAGEEGRRTQEEIRQISREAGIALCGPNCMGILNPWGRSTTYLHEVRDSTSLAGNVGLISQSGSICIALVNDVRRYGFSTVISSGNEASLNTADYLDYLIDDPRTKVIATFTETVRDPERYVAALDRARAANKPVVVLKVGRSERSKRAIMSHTGGLAGESRVFSALLERHGAVEVTDLDEMSEVLAACQGRTWPKGRRIAVVTGSGGQSELIVDLATSAGLDLPPLDEAVRTSVAAVIGHVSADGNPLDAWGNGDFTANLAHALKVLGESSGQDAIVIANDASDAPPAGSMERATNYARLVQESAARSEIPHYVLMTRAGIMNTQATRMLVDDGVALVSGIRQGLSAIDGLGRFASPSPQPRVPRPATGPSLRDVIGTEGRRTIHEGDSKRLLAASGIPCCREGSATSLEEVRLIAREIGYPVVLKALADDIPHKSEHGLVAVGIRDEDTLARACERMTRALDELKVPAAFLVQEMVVGMELFAGVSRDPDFGLFLAFGLGGVDIESLREFTLRPLPLREGEADAMVAAIRGGMLARAGRDRADGRASLVSCLYALSDFVAQNEADIQEIDINPIKLLSTGECVCVDALIVPRLRAKI
jgi:acetate---CoA ligase (ADP-forming)